MRIKFSILLPFLRRSFIIHASNLGSDSVVRPRNGLFGLVWVRSGLFGLVRANSGWFGLKLPGGGGIEKDMRVVFG